MVKAVTLTMDGPEPTLVYSRLEDLPDAIRIAKEMRLPLTNPPSVDDELLILIRRALRELDLEPRGWRRPPPKAGWPPYPPTPRDVPSVALTPSWRP